MTWFPITAAVVALVGITEATPRVMLNRRAAGHEAALLATGSQAGSLIKRTQKMQQELQIASRRVASLMREHPKELHKVEGLLHTASRMIKHSRVAHSLQQRSSARIALLARKANQNQDASAQSEIAEGKRVLLHYADGMSKVAKVDKGILAATRKAEEQIKQLFSGDNQRIGFEVAQLLGTTEEEEREVVAMELHDAHEARSEAGQRRGSFAPKKPHRAVLAESSSSMRAKLRARLEPVKRALTQHIGLAMRQARLAERGEDLATQLQETSNSVIEGLQGDPDPVDHDVVVELQKHLGAAQGMLRELAFFHKEMAADVGRTAGALVNYGRKLVKKDHKHHAAQLMQQRARTSALTALTTRVKRAARRTMHHAAAELRNEHHIFAETALAEKAVQMEVKGPGAAQVRSIVGRLLRRAEQAEKGAARATRMEMHQAREGAR